MHRQKDGHHHQEIQNDLGCVAEEESTRTEEGRARTYKKPKILERGTSENKCGFNLKKKHYSISTTITPLTPAPKQNAGKFNPVAACRLVFCPNIVSSNQPTVLSKKGGLARPMLENSSNNQRAIEGRKSESMEDEVWKSNPCEARWHDMKKNKRSVSHTVAEYY